MQAAGGPAGVWTRASSNITCVFVFPAVFGFNFYSAIGALFKIVVRLGGDTPMCSQEKDFRKVK